MSLSLLRFQKLSPEETESFFGAASLSERVLWRQLFLRDARRNKVDANVGHDAFFAHGETSEVRGARVLSCTPKVSSAAVANRALAGAAAAWPGAPPQRAPPFLSEISFPQVRDALFRRRVFV